MSNLYELSAALMQLNEMAEDPEIDQQAIVDTIESVQMDFDEKAANMGYYIKNLSAKVEMIKKEEERLAAKRKALSNRVDNMKEYAKRCLELAGKKKAGNDILSISLKNNAESVRVNDLEYLKGNPQRFWKERNWDEKDLDKTAIKRALQNGEDVPGVELIRTQSLVVR